jgi:CspA family cold shock protein
MLELAERFCTMMKSGPGAVTRVLDRTSRAPARTQRAGAFGLTGGDCEVALGTVRWFNSTKGYGFIKPDAGGSDVFVHISAVEKADLTVLADGARISYELVTKRDGKAAADNLRLG